MKKRSTPSNQQVRTLMRAALAGITPRTPRAAILNAILAVAHSTPPATTP